MGKKKCDLCNRGVARMFCEADHASLCWDCDVKVHGANFLVAKHTRCLLCSACHSPTPWKASGLGLGRTVTICESCRARKKNSGAGNHRNLSQEIDNRGFDDGAESYDDDEEDEESDDEEEEAENQMVPWDSLSAASSSSSISSGEEAFSGDGDLVAKRTRQDLNESRPLKRSRDDISSRSTAKINSISRLHGERKSNGCDTSSSSSTLVFSDLSR